MIFDQRDCDIPYRVKEADFPGCVNLFVIIL